MVVAGQIMPAAFDLLFEATYKWVPTPQTLPYSLLLWWLFTLLCVALIQREVEVCVHFGKVDSLGV